MGHQSDHYSIWSYQQLLIQQPHVSYGGLWRVGYLFFIICPDLGTAKSFSGERLVEWFDNKCRVVTAPVSLATAVPEGAEQVLEQTAEQRALQWGAPRTIRDLLVDLSVMLPREFPEFLLKNPGAEIIVVTKRKLSDEERKILLQVCSSLGEYPELTFQEDHSLNPRLETFRHKFRDGDIDLIPARRLPLSIGQSLRCLVEDDEDFWSSIRTRLFSSFDLQQESILPNCWQDRDSLSCFIDATVSAENGLRTYLSIYDEVILAPPLAERMDETLNALDVTPSELISLMECGRLRLVLPQSIDRYNVDWLQKAADVSSGSIILSRKLAAATVADARKRMPFLFPPLSARERYELLHYLVSVFTALPEPKRSLCEKFIEELAQAWAMMDWSINSRGSVGTSHIGVGLIASSLVKHITGRDISLELWAAASKVEHASALGAHAFAQVTAGYDETKACDLVAGLYSSHSSLMPRKALTAVEGILGIDSRVPIVPFAKEFYSEDVARFRRLVVRMGRENVDNESLVDTIERFNSTVRKYEKRPDLLKALNVVGLTSATATAIGVVPDETRHLVPLLGTLFGYICHRLYDELPRISGNVGKIMDLANAYLAGVRAPDVVMVARMKRDIRGLRR